MPNHPEIPTAITTLNGTALPFSEIDNIFAQSDLGKILQENIRYEGYKPPHLPKTDWQKILGADINNLAHMPLTRGITRSFLRHQQQEIPFSQENSQILLLAATTHDWAEAIVGDKNGNLKTEADEAKESDVYAQLLKKYLGNLLPSQILNKAHETATNRDSQLGWIFNSIEKIGYLRSGLNAWEIGQKADPDLKKHLHWMASNVIGSQTVPLIRYAETLYPVYQYLDNARFKIIRIFQEMPKNVFDQFPVDDKNERAAQIEKFMDAKKAWYRSLFGPIF